MNGTVTISIQDYESYKKLKIDLYTVLNNDFLEVKYPCYYSKNLYIKKITEDEKVQKVIRLSEDLVQLKTNNKLLQDIIDKKDYKILLLEKELNNKTQIEVKKVTFKDKINKFLNP